MKKLIIATSVAALAVTTAVPAQAAGFLAKESWTHGVEGIEKFVDSATCDFMKSHAKLMRIQAGQSYEVNKKDLMGSKFVRDYMSRRIDQGAGDHAKDVPADVRESLIDLGILATLRRAATCDLLAGNSQTVADKEYDEAKNAGNEKYTNIDPVGLSSDIPVLFQSFSAGISS